MLSRIWTAAAAAPPEGAVAVASTAVKKKAKGKKGKKGKGKNSVPPGLKNSATQKAGVADPWEGLLEMDFNSELGPEECGLLTPLEVALAEVKRCMAQGVFRVRSGCPLARFELCVFPFETRNGVLILLSLHSILYHFPCCHSLL